MTSSQAEERLQSGLRPILQSLGFSEHAPLSYYRNRGDRLEILNFGGRMDRRIFKFSFVVGIRFPQIESILRPDDDNPTYPTISAPIHFLHPGRKHFEWAFGANDDLALIIALVRADIESLAAKFFDRYSSLMVVEHDLRLGSAGADWHILGREQITEVLAAIAKLDGRDTEANQIVDSALADPRNEKPAKQRRLEQLKLRIVN